MKMISKGTSKGTIIHGRLERRPLKRTKIDMVTWTELIRLITDHQ